MAILPHEWVTRLTTWAKLLRCAAQRLSRNATDIELLAGNGSANIPLQFVYEFVCLSIYLFMFVYVPIYISVCLFVYLFVYVCLRVYLHFHLSVCISIFCLFVYLSEDLPAYRFYFLFMCISTCLSLHLLVYLFFACLFACLFVRLFSNGLYIYIYACVRFQ